MGSAIMLLNIFRSWKSDFYHEDILDSLKVYTGKELGEIAAHGYNAIWLRGKLGELTSSKILPEFGKSHEEYLTVLRLLVKRASNYNIKVYIYFNEPLAVPAKNRFWENNRDIRGELYFWPYEPKGDYYSLCISTAKVKDYLRDSFYLLFKLVEGLAGIICITASEHITFCYSHIDITGLYNGHIPGVWKSFRQMECPRCKRRLASESVVELLNTMQEGMKEGSSSSRLIAWNWSWDMFEPDPQRKIISRLNRDIIIMSDFERGGSKRVLGKDRKVDEYSLSYIGPSDKFKKVYYLIKRTGHCLMAKLQVGTTHELATIPNLPLIDNIFKKVRYINSKNIYGVMATWTVGNMRTLNTYIFGHAIKNKTTCEELFYNKIKNYLRGLTSRDISNLKHAWRLFSQAMDNYPFSINFLYESPINYAPAYWLPPRKIRGISLGESWFIEKRGDNLSLSLDGYRLKEVIKGLGLICQNWEKGIRIYEYVFQEHNDNHSQEEYRCAVAIGHIFRSIFNIYKLYALCSKWNKKSIKRYIALCKDELKNCRDFLILLDKDKRLGFHIECQDYMYDAKKVKNKVRRLKVTLASMATLR